ncbi:MAG: sugar phosphate isomerase/epimerase family protein, partial [Anaerovoracaceae bacterium]
GGDRIGLTADAAEMMKLISDPRIGVCLDVGHALAAGHSIVPIEKWIDVLGPYICHFHIHNNLGNSDTHNSLGDGILNFRSIFAAAETCCNPDVTFTIESREAAPSVKWLIDEGYL